MLLWLRRAGRNHWVHPAGRAAAGRRALGGLLGAAFQGLAMARTWCGMPHRAAFLVQGLMGADVRAHERGMVACDDGFLSLRFASGLPGAGWGVRRMSFR